MTILLGILGIICLISFAIQIVGYVNGVDSNGVVWVVDAWIFIVSTISLASFSIAKMLHVVATP